MNPKIFRASPPMHCHFLRRAQAQTTVAEWFQPRKEKNTKTLIKLPMMGAGSTALNQEFARFAAGLTLLRRRRRFIASIADTRFFPG